LLEGWSVTAMLEGDHHVVPVQAVLKGDPHLLNRYRPIGLCNTLAKLHTAVINSILTHVCESGKLLSESQAGYREQRILRRPPDVRILLPAASPVGLLKTASCTRRTSIWLYDVDYSNAFGSVQSDRLIHMLCCAFKASLRRLSS